MGITIKDIADKLGLSKGTISKGLNNATDISEETRRLILQTAVEMGYTSKNAKQQIKVCIFIENMRYSNSSQFGYDIVHGFCDLAEREGWMVDIYPITPEEQRSTPYDIFMLQEKYQAAFILGFSLLDPWMEEFHHTHFPTVLYDNYIPHNPNTCSIGCDSNEGFQHAVKHLVELGHKKIGLISGPLDSYITRARYQAYLSAMEQYHLEVNRDYIGLGYFTSETSKHYIPKLYAQGVTAILFSHDIRAISGMTECADINIRIPEDLSIIGFDDLPISATCSPPLTTIQQDREALGKCAYYVMSSLLNHVPIGSILLRAPLIVRDSTGPAPQQSNHSLHSPDTANHPELR